MLSCFRYRQPRHLSFIMKCHSSSCILLTATEPSLKVDRLKVICPSKLQITDDPLSLYLGCLPHGIHFSTLPPPLSTQMHCLFHGTLYNVRGSSGSSPASFFLVVWSDRALKISPRRFLIHPPLNAITIIAISVKPWEDFRTSHDGIGLSGDVKTSEIHFVMF